MARDCSTYKEILKLNQTALNNELSGQRNGLGTEEGKTAKKYERREKRPKKLGEGRKVSLKTGRL